MAGCVSTRSKGDGPVPIQKCMARTGGAVGARVVGALGSQRELLGQSVPEHPRRLGLRQDAWVRALLPVAGTLLGNCPK